MYQCLCNDFYVTCIGEKMTSNNSEEKLDTMTEAPNESYQQQNDRINQLQILFLFAH